MLPMNFCMIGSRSGSYSSMVLNFRHSSWARCLISLSSRHLASKSFPAKIFSSSLMLASSFAASKKHQFPRSNCSARSGAAAVSVSAASFLYPAKKAGNVSPTWHFFSALYRDRYGRRTEGKAPQGNMIYREKLNIPRSYQHFSICPSQKIIPLSLPPAKGDPLLTKKERPVSQASSPRNLNAVPSFCGELQEKTIDSILCYAISKL